MAPKFIGYSIRAVRGTRCSLCGRAEYGHSIDTLVEYMRCQWEDIPVCWSVYAHWRTEGGPVVDMCLGDYADAAAAARVVYGICGIDLSADIAGDMLFATTLD